jgi:hypothetical protein
MHLYFVIHVYNTYVLWYAYVSPKRFTVYLLVKKKYIIAWTLEWTPPPEGPLEAYVCTDVYTYVHTSV